MGNLCASPTASTISLSCWSRMLYSCRITGVPSSSSGDHQSLTTETIVIRDRDTSYLPPFIWMVLANFSDTGSLFGSRIPSDSSSQNDCRVASSYLLCLLPLVCVWLREGFSPLGETGPPKGEEALLPTTLSGLGSADGSCPRSLLDLCGWGVLWGRGFEEAILVQTTVVECENKNNKR